jgi:hypothetical protein
MNYNQEFYPGYPMPQQPMLYPPFNPMSNPEMPSPEISESGSNTMIIVILVIVCCCCCLCYISSFAGYYFFADSLFGNSSIVYDSDNNPILIKLITENDKNIYLSFYKNKTDFDKAVADNKIDIVYSVSNSGSNEFYKDIEKIRSGLTKYNYVDPKGPTQNPRIKTFMSNFASEIFNKDKNLNKNILIQNARGTNIDGLFILTAVILNNYFNQSITKTKNTFSVLYKSYDDEENYNKFNSLTDQELIAKLRNI